MVSVDKWYQGAGERIFRVRRNRAFTRDQLAEKAEISAKHLYNIERGRQGFSALVLLKICQALDVRSAYILTGEGDCRRKSSE